MAGFGIAVDRCVIPRGELQQATPGFGHLVDVNIPGAKIVTAPSVIAEMHDRQVVTYILSSLQKSRENLNYLFIFATSAIAILLDLLF